MKRSTMRAAAAGAVLVLGTLAGCGGGDDDSASGDSASSETEGTDTETSETAGSTEDYCTSLEDAKAQFETLEGSDPDALGNFDDAFETLRGLGEAAPEEVAADWDTLIGGIDRIEQAVEDAGLTLDELAELASNPSALPEGVDIAKLQALGKEMKTLDSKEFSAAGDAISKHAEAECDISLDDSTSSGQ